MNTDIIENSKKFWNQVHSNNKRDSIKIDDWLDKFLNIIESCKTPIIDLGCGSGNDTLYLLNKGKEVIPCDLSKNSIDSIKKDFPEIKDAKCFNMLDGLPFEDSSCELIIADLCLHYFTEADTKKVLKDIQRVLTKNGHLIFRVNSVNDVNHGAGQGLEVEHHLYLTSDNILKRFFDKSDLLYFLSDFEIEYLNEETMTRYKLDKKLYRGCVKKY